MKNLLASLLILFSFAPTSFAFTTNAGCSHSFDDTVNHWAEAEICELSSIGLLEGYSERNFAPNENMTRAEFVKIMVESQSYNVYAVQSAAFTDTDPSDWFYAVVSFAHSKGLVSGYNDNSFKPNNDISRAEAIELLVNASGYSDADTTDLNHSFYDVDGDDWFAVALAIGLENDIVQGYGDDSFRPNNPITRAEACVMLSRALDTILQD